jgi:sporulation protein YlmC with PRC-barrel domain
MMRLSDLEAKCVVGEGGETVGRVFEVHVEHGCVTALICGGAGFWERLTGKAMRRRIGWERVRSIRGAQIVVDTSD